MVISNVIMTCRERKYVMVISNVIMTCTERGNELW